MPGGVAETPGEPGTPRETRLLAVHLKASCNLDPLTAKRDDCRLLQRQVPILENWIDQRAAAGAVRCVVQAKPFTRRGGKEERVRRRGLTYRLLLIASAAMRLDVLLFGRIRSGPFFALLAKVPDDRVAS